ncbi:uncharacterized protein LOC124280915 [Haliotis rubra]|uniref:uncharacterized protein LOC124280915 n=1 Tax=Haliotis rubra TaxID=36100 RepID=UPI001EE53F86|nr:uncharacterized protein LOC124280915 [Haliotis rubra]
MSPLEVSARSSSPTLNRGPRVRGWDRRARLDPLALRRLLILCLWLRVQMPRLPRRGGWGFRFPVPLLVLAQGPLRIPGDPVPAPPRPMRAEESVLPGLPLVSWDQGSSVVSVAGAGSSFGSSLPAASVARPPTGSGFGSSSRGDPNSDSGSGAKSIDVGEVEELEGTFRFSSALQEVRQRIAEYIPQVYTNMSLGLPPLKQAYRTYEEVYRECHAAGADSGP